MKSGKHLKSTALKGSTVRKTFSLSKTSKADSSSSFIQLTAKSLNPRKTKKIKGCIAFSLSSTKSKPSKKTRRVKKRKKKK